MSKPGADHADFIPTRRTLLSRLKNLDDNESWRAFFNTYWKLIYGVALRAGLTSAEAQDVVQETVLAVTRSIGTFKYDPRACAFKTWLMRVTRSKVVNQFRSRDRHRLVQSLEGVPLDGGTPLDQIEDPSANVLEAAWEEEWAKNLMDAAIARVKRRVHAEQFQLFDFHVLKEWPVLKVSRTFEVSVGQVYLAKHRISKLLKKEVQTLETKGW
jgi:RNA polymerase sigma-70 factor (ECF subfamily)